ncbi:SDR family NAD(P)-dependent oxidoreductase [Streptomyces sp. NPDC096311]|uniref:SDR family NAD(P)-dependent oxidoreductase n=1 Tax=Streptomyces sp. NPDC096311 TaxID=3366083 RepID=UPI0038020E02
MNAQNNTSAHRAEAPKKPKQRLNGVRDKNLVVNTMPIERLDLRGKRLLVVGGTNGLGRAVAQQALESGAQVTVVGRTFRDAPSERLTFVQADLSSLREAVRLGEELDVESFDVAYFSLGILAAPEREETPEGIERDMAISYLSRFAVLKGLSSRLGTARPAGAPQPRVFIMGAPGNGMTGDPEDFNSEKNYKAMKAHANTVVGNEVLALVGAERLPGPTYFGLNPGFIKTGIRSNYLGEGSFKHRFAEGLVGLFGQSPEDYGRRMVPLLFTEDLEGRTGIMFNSKAEPILPTEGLTQATVDQYMNASEALLRRAMG